MEQSNETINNSVNTEEGKEEQADTMGILDKFCWPGFLMPQFWGICNGMPVGLLLFLFLHQLCHWHLVLEDIVLLM